MLRYFNIVIVLTLTWSQYKSYAFSDHSLQNNHLETCDQNNNCLLTQDNRNLRENQDISVDHKLDINKNEELFIKPFNNEITGDSDDLKKDLKEEDTKRWVEDNNVKNELDISGSPEVTQNDNEVMPSEDVLKWMGLDVLFVIRYISEDMESALNRFKISGHLFVITSIIAFNLCLMKFIIFILRLSKKEAELRDISCTAQRKVYYFGAEKEKLQTEVQKEREKAQSVVKRMQIAEHKAISLDKEFEKVKAERDELQEKVIILENELESATEAGLELNTLLNDFLTSQKENVELNSSIEALQLQITKQADIVGKYEKTAKLKEKENCEYKEKLEKMNNEIERLKSVLKETEHNLEIVQSNNEEMKVSKSELNSTFNTIQEEYFRLQNKVDNYITRNDELISDVEKFREEIDSLKDQIVNKNLEIESMKEILSNFKRPEETGDETDNENEKSLNDLYDYVVKIQLESKNVEMERNGLNSKIEELENECKQLNDRLLQFEEYNKSLKIENQTSIEEKMKAVLELQVLTKYYKEKELEFGKEIGVQQVQRIQKEEDVTSLASQLVSLEEENISYRSELQSMKKQIEDSESNYKSIIIKLEKQVHENWLLGKNAEQKLEESKAEATALRETLLSSVTSPTNGFGGDVSFMDNSASSVPLQDHLGGSALPPPPPLPPFNHLMPGMHLPFNDQSNPSALWNQGLGPMGVRLHLQDIQSDNTTTNNNISFSSDYQSSHPSTYMPHIQQRWNSPSNRDTYSPSSHRSNGSPHSSSNMYTQPTVPQSYYSNPLMSTPLSSPTTNSTNLMTGNYFDSMKTVSSPLVNSSGPPVSLLSNQMRVNQNKQNFDYSKTEYNNGSNNSSRPTSRNDTNSSHTSIV